MSDPLTDAEWTAAIYALGYFSGWHKQQWRPVEAI